MRDIVKSFIPPILLSAVRKLKSQNHPAQKTLTDESLGDGSFWGSQSDLLDEWGKDHVWNEIEMFLYDKKGKVLDIACGTGAAMNQLKTNVNLEMYGIDNSADLLNKCEDKGFPRSHLILQNVLEPLPYTDSFFEYSYSIGLLHYIKEEAIDDFVNEIDRITRTASFHQLPVSLSGKDENVVHAWHDYNNNSGEWWLNKFRNKFPGSRIIQSGWKDNHFGFSKGIWLVCKR